jgi:AraC family transcriptional regulator
MASATTDHHVPAARRVAKGDGWRVDDVVCTLGPHDRAFEEQHGEVTIAIVLAGSFLYRSESGRSIMYPGSLLLGNAGACFECGHDHGTGDHCLSFHFSKTLFAEMAAAVASSSRFRFSVTMLPALRRLSGLIVKVETGSRDETPLRMEELSIELAEGVLATLAGGVPRIADPPARDRKRISDAVRYIEETADEPLGLGEVAQVARMSRYHFLRTFRRTLGVTPYQLLLNLRMRRAATALKTSAAPVATVAFASGFGDLSTFNARFRGVIGMTPQAFRKA